MSPYLSMFSARGQYEFILNPLFEICIWICCRSTFLMKFGGNKNLFIYLKMLQVDLSKQIY